MRLAEIIHQAGEAYQYTHRLRPAQYKALRDIGRCRTEHLGGHRQWCEHCGFERYLYHSCRNRHCPQCQSKARAEWVQARQQDLLPVPYFHNVFTLPHELNPLILYSEQNQRALLKLLFDATAQTLLEFGQRELGGQLGFTLVLHTWDQQLRAHFHLHCLIASGALSQDGSRWIAGGAKFLFPVRALSQVFRGKFLDGLEKLLQQERLTLPPQLSQLGGPEARQRLLRRWRKKSWVVYSKAPFASPSKLLDYLGRYTHRVAISEDRILSCEKGHVRISWRDRRDGDRSKTLCLEVEEFLRRFLQHVLPDGFVRIRHYGFLANRTRKAKLACCRSLLGVCTEPAKPAAAKTLAEWLKSVLGLEMDRCPECGEQLHCERLLPRTGPVQPREPSSTTEETTIPDTS